MSSIASLQAQLSQLERINRELHAQLSELYTGISSADQSLTNFRNGMCATLENSTQRIQSSHQRVVDSIEIQGEIDHMYARFKQMELANKKIRACNNKKYYDFANYRTIRKIVRGILDNLSLHMVSDSVIYQSVERQHLQTPDYWLTCALLSIMAWEQDDKPLADRAMERAIRLDKKSSAVFYMLFNLNSAIQREDAALAWFSLYQTCELKGSDEKTFLMLFALLSQAIRDAANTRTRGEIQQFIRQVISANVRAEGYQESQILQQIETYLCALSPEDPLSLPLLRKCCGDYSQIAQAVTLAANNANILQFLLDLKNVSSQERDEYLNRFIESLIDAPNAVERSVYDEIDYNELIIRCQGDVDQAKEIWNEERQRRSSPLNLISEMMKWVYSAAGQDINRQSRQNMFHLTLELQRKAYQQYVEHYRALTGPVHPIALGDYETQADFNNRDGEMQKIQAFYCQQQEEALAQVKSWPPILAFVLAGAAAVGAVAAAPALLGGAVVCAAVGGGLLFSNQRRRKLIAQTCLQNIQAKQTLLEQLFSEYDQMCRQYAAYDGRSDQVLHTLEQF